MSSSALASPSRRNSGCVATGSVKPSILPLTSFSVTLSEAIAYAASRPSGAKATRSPSGSYAVTRPIGNPIRGSLRKQQLDHQLQI